MMCVLLKSVMGVRCIRRSGGNYFHIAVDMDFARTEWNGNPGRRMLWLMQWVEREIFICFYGRGLMY